MTTSERDLPPANLESNRAAPTTDRPPGVPRSRTAHLDFVDQLLIAAAETTGSARVRLLNEAVVRFKPMADALGLPRETARELAYKQLTVSAAVQAKLNA